MVYTKFMAIIKVNHKGNIVEFLVDQDVYEYLNSYTWTWRCGYAGRSRTKKDIPGNRWVHLHREVLRLNNMQIPEGMFVDHINRVRTDNRLENLRVVTRSENGLNVSKEEQSRRKTIMIEAMRISATLPRTKKQTEASKVKAKKINSLGLNRHIGKDSPASKRVINTVTGEIFDCIRMAAEHYNLVYSTLKSRLNGGLKNNTDLKLMD
jgi:HNH endonuclease